MSGAHPSRSLPARLDRTLSYLTVLAGVLLVASLVRPGGLIGARISAIREGQLRLSALAELNAQRVHAPARLLGLRAEPDLIIFSDYECPFCRRLDSELPEVAGHLPGLTVELRHLPLSNHPSARLAAGMAICSERAGRLAAVHAALFATDWRNRGDFPMVRRAGVSPDSLVECAKGPSVQERIDREVSIARRLGATGTPLLVVGDFVHSGYLPPTEVASLIEKWVRTTD